MIEFEKCFGKCRSGLNSSAVTRKLGVVLKRVQGIHFIADPGSWMDFHCTTWIHSDKIAKGKLCRSLVVEFEKVFSQVWLRIGNGSANLSCCDQEIGCDIEACVGNPFHRKSWQLNGFSLHDNDSF